MREHREIRSLTGLRGVAVAYVVFLSRCPRDGDVADRTDELLGKRKDGGECLR
jgi:hypothetical protein